MDTSIQNTISKRSVTDFNNKVDFNEYIVVAEGKLLDIFRKTDTSILLQILNKMNINK